MTDIVLSLNITGKMDGFKQPKKTPLNFVHFNLSTSESSFLGFVLKNFNNRVHQSSLILQCLSTRTYFFGFYEVNKGSFTIA